jgi:hypothetical protein
MIKREYSIPRLWDCGSNLYQTLSLSLSLSLVLRWLESSELPIMIVTIFVLPLCGSFFMRWFLRYKGVFCPWCMNGCICYPVLVCLFLSN